MKKSLILLCLIGSLSFGAGFMDMGMSDDIHVMLSSKKVLSEGENSIKIELNRDHHGGAIIKAKDVRVKFFMPEMVGMPYMETKDICKSSSNAYKCKVNFAMGGTWQYIVFIKDEDGEEYKYKGSVTLGQESSHQHH